MACLVADYCTMRASVSGVMKIDKRCSDGDDMVSRHVMMSRSDVHVT